MLNPEESIPNDEPSDDGGDSTSDNEGGGGYTICMNCHADGTHDVYMKPLEPASEEQYPDGLFGLETLEDALKGVIALKRQGMDSRSAEHADMMSEFEGNSYDDKTKQAMSGGY